MPRLKVPFGGVSEDLSFLAAMVSLKTFLTVFNEKVVVEIPGVKALRAFLSSVRYSSGSLSIM